MGFFGDSEEWWTPQEDPQKVIVKTARLLLERYPIWHNDKDQEEKELWLTLETAIESLDAEKTEKDVIELEDGKD